MTTANGKLLTGQSGPIAWRTAGISPPGGYPIDDPTQIRIWDFTQPTSPNYWLQYNPGVNSDPTLKSNRWGPEHGISLRARGLNPKRAVYWFKCTPGGTGLAKRPITEFDMSPYSDPHVDSVGATVKYFPFMLDRIKEASAVLLNNSLRRIISWDTHFHAGEESDALSWETANALFRDLPMFFRLCREWTSCPAMRVVIVQAHINSLTHIDTSSDAVNRLATVRAAQAQFVANDPRARLVNQDDLLMVEGHLEYTQLDELSRRMFEMEQSLG